MRTRIALAIYTLIGVIDLVLGTIYLTTDQFLSYHAQAVGTSWNEVEGGTQTLILALMKVAGGGWLTLGIFTLALAVGPFRRGHQMARWLLPIGTVIFWTASFIATWSVYRSTGAITPWAPSLGVIGFALLALIVDAPWSSNRKGENQRNIDGTI